VGGPRYWSADPRVDILTARPGAAACTARQIPKLGRSAGFPALLPRCPLGRNGPHDRAATADLAPTPVSLGGYCCRPETSTHGSFRNAEQSSADCDARRPSRRATSWCATPARWSTSMPSGYWAMPRSGRRSNRRCSTCTPARPGPHVSPSAHRNPRRCTPASCRSACGSRPARTRTARGWRRARSRSSRSRTSRPNWCRTSRPAGAPRVTTLAVDNHGNHPVDVELFAEDPNDQLRFRMTRTARHGRAGHRDAHPVPGPAAQGFPAGPGQEPSVRAGCRTTQRRTGERRRRHGAAAAVATLAAAGLGRAARRDPDPGRAVVHVVQGRSSRPRPEPRRNNRTSNWPPRYRACVSRQRWPAAVAGVLPRQAVPARRRQPTRARQTVPLRHPYRRNRRHRLSG